MAPLFRNFSILAGLTVILISPAAEAKLARDVQIRAETIQDLKKKEDGFSAYLDKIYASPYVTQCELTNKSRVYKLARDLDNRKKIQAQVQLITKQVSSKNASARTNDAPAEDEDYRYRDYSGFIVRENLLPEGENEWVSDQSSWKQLFRYHDRLLAKEEGPDWDSLEARFGGILYDDLNRVSIGSGYNAAPASWSVIKQVLATSRACLQDSHCSFPRYTYLESRWLSVQPEYAELLQKIGSSDLVERDSENGINIYLKKIIKDVELDLPTPFRKNKSVHLSKDGTLTLPLVAGELYYMRDAISKYAESLWKSAAIKLHLNWKKRENPNFFSVLIGTDPTGRSLVSYDSKEVILYSEVRSHSIAHEIGHVLGFTDRYYTVWDDQKCEYSDISNPADLMSEPETGRVRAADFKQLIKEYRTP